MTRFTGLISLLALCVLAGCSKLEPITACDPVGDINVYCGMQTAEDIAALPDEKTLLLAHFPGMESGTGSISFFDTETEKLSPAYPAKRPVKRGWGDENCKDEPGDKMRPHGTHLHRIADGSWRYLVVNHGNREAVEMFEFHRNAFGKPALTWRGCVFPAENTMMNDVVGLMNGDVIYSKMNDHGDKLAMFKAALGFSTGEIWRWSKESGPVAYEQARAAMPNGLEISRDDKYLFANMYMEKEVWKMDVATGEIVAKANIANADNSAWTRDGRLLITTHTAGVRQMLQCFDEQTKACGASFKVYALNPDTMDSEAVFEHQGAPMGAATVAVPQAGRVYMGSFVGDRIISVPAF